MTLPVLMITFSMYTYLLVHGVSRLPHPHLSMAHFLAVGLSIVDDNDDSRLLHIHTLVSLLYTLRPRQHSGRAEFYNDVACGILHICMNVVLTVHAVNVS